MTAAALLPEPFAGLERFAATGVLPTTTARYQQRLASTMAEMQEFYDAVVPRGDEAIDYLCGFDLYDMPEKATNLMWLMASLSTVSFAIDIFLQPKIPSAGDAYLPWVKELAP